MTAGRALRLLPLALLAGCGSSSPGVLPPLGQIVLYVDTDAPVPEAPGVPRGPLDPVPLFDRLRIDGVDADGGAATRELDVTADQFRQAGISFGVLPDPRGTTMVRLRLFRAAVTIDGEPPVDSTLDVTFVMPTIPAEGIVESTALLPTDSAGSPVGPDQPASVTSGPPSPSAVGTWPGAQRVECSSPPAAGEVCMPGGAFWMGDPALLHSSDPQVAQRLVILSPFYLDATDVSVATYRAGGGPQPTPWSGQTTGDNITDFCTFTTSPGRFDAFPVSCLSFVMAQGYCRGKGGDLPSEAQFEYAASALGTAPYPWGSDEPGCGDVVFARAPSGAAYAGFPFECVTAGEPPGPTAGGTSLRDQLALPTGTLHDLVGNVHEFALDTWNRESEPCWSRLGVYQDPVCVTKSTLDPGTVTTARGGAFTGDGLGVRAASRGPIGDQFLASPDIGFRCARPAQ